MRGGTVARGGNTPWQKSMKRLLENLLRLLFPPVCAACRTPLATRGKFLCTECLSGVRRLESPRCTICGIPFESRSGPDHICGKCMKRQPSFRQAVSCFIYAGTVRKLIHRVKFDGDTYASRALCSLSSEIIKTSITQEIPLADAAKGAGIMVVPIPLHIARLRRRGFNQAVTMARRLFPTGTVQVDMLQRTRDTRPQMQLSVRQRHENLRGAFRLRHDRDRSVKGSDIILFDDILTTGATMENAARELVRAGAASVYVLTLSRAVQQGGLPVQ